MGDEHDPKGGHGDHDHDHAPHDAHDHHHEHAGHGAGAKHAHGTGQSTIAQDHAHEHAEATRPPQLTEGAGAGKTLFFDAFSGIAGDMTIAALLDLGVPLLVVERAVAALPIEGFHLHRGHVHRHGIVATTFDVHLEAEQPERTYGSIDAMLAASHLPPRVAELARAMFLRLGEAEAHVHRMPLAHVHFHEVGAVDAIVDIVGAAACLVHIGADAIVASPLPMGHGFVKARHGILPIPPPAVVDCLRGVPTYAVDVEAELVTPTGATIIATAASRFERWPTFAPERTGWGGGQRELADRPNVLRVVLGDARASAAVTAPAGTHVVLEANVDDLTGELAAHALASLLAAGALDAWAVPITMKKGRPALTIAALARAEDEARIADTILRETTSIGVRRTAATRTERPRRTVEVTTAYGPIPVKISEGPYGPAQVKPEFDACARAATQAAVSVREVIAAALEAYRHLSG